MKHRLLFLPGAGADPGFWKPLGDQIPDSWGKKYFGWPGLGHQKPDTLVNSLDDLARMVEKSLCDPPVDLLAQSMGGHVAIRLMLKHPDKIRRAVFTATGAGLNLAPFGGADWRPDYLKDYPNSKLMILDEDKEFNNEFQKITQPVLLLYADRDPICPVSVGERLSELLPHAKLKIINSNSHSFASDNPQSIYDHVMKHLGKTL